MAKIENINMKFLKKYRNVVLLNSLLAMGAIGSFVAYKKSDSQNLVYTSSSLERISNCGFDCEPQGIDRIVWGKEWKNEQAEVFSMELSPSDIWKIRVFRDNISSNYYRIEQESLNKNPNGYSKWKKIPDNNLITVVRQDLPETMQYNQKLKIRFGRYDEKINKIVEENADYFEYSEITKEEVETFNQARKRIEWVSDFLVNKDDTDINKVKKIYDYLIDHTEYRWDPEGKEITSLTIFDKYYMDCGGYADFMNIALNHLGIESFTALDDTHGHIWNIVNIDNKYYHLDATYSDTSSWENTSKYRYFLVSDSYMLADHRYFVAEKEVKCNEVYDLTGIVSNRDVEYRGLKGEEKYLPKGNLLGNVNDGAYQLTFRYK